MGIKKRLFAGDECAFAISLASVCLSVILRVRV